MPYFTVNRITDHVYHIFDALGVGMTLITGEKRALLFDTGYGIGNLAAEIRRITPLPLTVMNSHGHYDHACGNWQFAAIQMDNQEMPLVRKYTGKAFAERGIERARNQGVLPEDFTPWDLRDKNGGKPVPFEGKSFGLGGYRADIIPMSGHTPGSTGLLLAEDRILLAGDNWNPVTWIFFPECVSLPAYRNTLNGLLGLPFDRVICSHAPAARPRSQFERYVRNLDSLTLEKSEKVTIEPYGSIDTWAYPAGQEGQLVFDAKKM